MGDKTLAQITRLNAGDGPVVRTLHDLEESPIVSGGLPYPPEGADGADIGQAHAAAVEVQLRDDPRRRKAFVKVDAVVDSTGYGLTINGTTTSQASDADATVAEILKLVADDVHEMAEPVRAVLEDTDGDGKSDRITIEGGWSHISVSTVANSTTYTVTVTTPSDVYAVDYTSAGTGADYQSIAEGIVDALNASSAPVNADLEPEAGGDYTILVEPAGQTDVTLSVSGDLSLDATHSAADFTIADNSSGSAALDVSAEATDVKGVEFWARNAVTGNWSKVNNGGAFDLTENWTEVLSSLAFFDRLAVTLTSTDGRVGVVAYPALGS